MRPQEISRGRVALALESTMGTPRQLDGSPELSMDEFDKAKIAFSAAEEAEPGNPDVREALKTLKLKHDEYKARTKAVCQEMVTRCGEGGEEEKPNKNEAAGSHTGEKVARAAATLLSSSEDGSDAAGKQSPKGLEKENVNKPHALRPNAADDALQTTTAEKTQRIDDEIEQNGFAEITDDLQNLHEEKKGTDEELAACSDEAAQKTPAEPVTSPSQTALRQQRQDEERAHARKLFVGFAAIFFGLLSAGLAAAMTVQHFLGPQPRGENGGAGGEL